ncbi:MAG: hypothetical protein EBR23_00335 [Planctomycetia bacterium]|nr:hypothetical protein [Planctomycetia bacterium]
MITAALILGAAFAFAGPDVLVQIRELMAKHAPKVGPRQALAVALLVAALLSWAGPQRDASPTPAPDAGPLVLRGLFRGPSAAEDANTIAALTEELAAEIEWDGLQPEPMFRTGVAIDTLRDRARELRCRGVSIGARQPAARDAIAAYLEQAVGKSGGPISPEQRARWITAFRDIARAAADVTR